MEFRIFIFFVIFGFTSSRLVYLSCKEIRAFVNGHNSRRLQLARGEIKNQTAATDMKFMVWDEEIAAKASKWASKSEFSHNPNKTLKSGRFPVGENLYMKTTPIKNYTLIVESALNKWFDEHTNYQYGRFRAGDSNRPQPIAHFTQMAWSNSTYLGCGICEKSIKSGWKNYYVVCNYGPSGNNIGQVPYKTSGRKSGTLTCGTDNCYQRYGKRCK